MVTLGPEPWLLMKHGWFEHPSKQKIKLPISEKGGSKKISFIFLLNTQEEPCIVISRSIFLTYNQWKVCQPCKANTTPCKYYFSKKLPPLVTDLPFTMASLPHQPASPPPAPHSLPDSLFSPDRALTHRRYRQVENLAQEPQVHLGEAAEPKAGARHLPCQGVPWALPSSRGWTWL